MLKPSEITVIVPTRNERRNVPAFLASLPHHAQLIAVDSSDDDTPDVIMALRPANTLVLRRSCNIAVARQFGAEAALTPWLVFTDADIIFAPDYFQRILCHEHADVVYGPKISADRYCRYYFWFSQAQALSHRLGLPAASGSNLAIRRVALMAVGGFDMQLRCNEDSEIAWRLQRSAYKVDFDPALLVYARDHRRLDRGVMRKTLHSLTRCAALYLNLMPAQYRNRDWGYWSPPRRNRATDATQT